ncbi:MAG TPA: hypothetical protein VFO16_22870 [Pseudonocardiaceae bacterium]|nr:hypothetical protein [Pseudonocardiaceae bacterium]
MKLTKLSITALTGSLLFGLTGLTVTPAQASAAALASFSGEMRIVDHENFGKNEIGTIKFGPIGESQTPFIRTGCVGNEVKGWVRVDTTGSTPEGWLKVKIEGRLYEGASCATNDLDGKEVRFIWLRPNATTTHTFRVNNTDEGGDYIDFKLVMRN